MQWPRAIQFGFGAPTAEPNLTAATAPKTPSIAPGATFAKNSCTLKTRDQNPDQNPKEIVSVFASMNVWLLYQIWAAPVILYAQVHGR
jgi:hypothetical protein